MTLMFSVLLKSCIDDDIVILIVDSVVSTFHAYDDIVCHCHLLRHCFDILFTNLDISFVPFDDLLMAVIW